MNLILFFYLISFNPLNQTPKRVKMFVAITKTGNGEPSARLHLIDAFVSFVCALIVVAVHYAHNRHNGVLPFYNPHGRSIQNVPFIATFFLTRLQRRARTHPIMKKHAIHFAEVSSQAARIIAKFGNANRLSKATQRLADVKHNPKLFRARHTIVRWTYPEHRDGTGGTIPSSALPIILAAARLEGVLITAEDLYAGLKTPIAAGERAACE